eukprot:scaffold22961_cov29-Phaeocystis_antarctica.AAC.1
MQDSHGGRRAARGPLRLELARALRAEHCGARRAAMVGGRRRGREGRGARALSLRGPTASARALRYPTQHPASGSCASATEAALFASGSSANALRFPCDLLCRASVRRCKEGERERHKKLSYTPRNDGLLDNLYFLTPEVNGLQLTDFLAIPIEK